MKKTNDMRWFIRRLKKERRKRVLRLPTIYYELGLTAAAVLCFAASFFLRRRGEWISNLFLSLGGGFVTGMVLFLLANLRANWVRKLQEESAALKQLDEKLRALRSFQEYYGLLAFCRCFREEGRCAVTDAARMMVLLDELEDAIYALPYGVDDEFVFEQYDPLNRDILKMHRDAFDEIGGDEARARKWIKDVDKDMTAAADMIHEPLQKREDQLRFLRNQTL